MVVVIIHVQNYQKFDFDTLSIIKNYDYKCNQNGDQLKQFQIIQRVKRIPQPFKCEIKNI